jgi:hypothetical protein
MTGRFAPWCATLLAQMFTFFNEHPSELADLSALRAEHSGLMRLETWLRATGWKP